jgi:arabinose-5-phosphate isomerase
MPNTARQDVSAADLIRTEADALLLLAQRLDGPQRESFNALLTTLEDTVRAGRRVVLTGMGKSGLIARKIAATLTSLSVPSAFLHPAEATHGDLGLLCAGDTLLALSYSGETEEILRLFPAVARLGVALAAFTGCPDSTLARACAHTLDVSVEQEACAHQLAPTASTTAMLALGDALAVRLSQQLGFAPQTFAALHPGGALGRRLTPVRELAHTGADCPRVPPDAPMPTVIHEMSARRLGMTTVQNSAGRLLGILSDGDLRRLFERDGPNAFHHTAAEVMNPQPRTVAPALFAEDALELLEAHKITALVVTEDGSAHGQALGVVHLHDLVEALGLGSREGRANARAG